MFEWKNEYAVGIGSIDAQHQNLFAIARELYAAMSTGQGKSSLARLLDRLVQYTAVHFSHEERLMRVAEYADFHAHKAQHDALTKQVLAFQADFDSGKVSLTIQLLQFLKDWLEGHIKVSDFRVRTLSQAKSAGVRGSASLQERGALGILKAACRPNSSG